MFNLKLINALSYTGKVTATKDNPNVTVETKEEADYLVGLGIFEATATEIVEAPGAETTGDEDGPNIDKMRKAELEAFAAEKGIDLTGCPTNEEKKAKIKAALAEKEDSGEDTEGDEPDYE